MATTAAWRRRRRVDRRIRQFRQAGRVRLHLADADDRNEGRVAQEHEIRSRRPRAVALPEAVEGFQLSRCSGNERLSPRQVPSEMVKALLELAALKWPAHEHDCVVRVAWVSSQRTSP